jgi:hypothetical protein
MREEREMKISGEVGHIGGRKSSKTAAVAKEERRKERKIR